MVIPTMMLCFEAGTLTSSMRLLIDVYDVSSVSQLGSSSPLCRLHADYMLPSRPCSASSCSEAAKISCLGYRLACLAASWGC